MLLILAQLMISAAAQRMQGWHLQVSEKLAPDIYQEVPASAAVQHKAGLEHVKSGSHL